MVNSWDNFESDKKGTEVPIKPVNGSDEGPKILGPPPQHIVKFIGGDMSPVKQAVLIPNNNDRNWGLLVLILALAAAWFIGLLMQAQFHIV